MIHKSDGSGPQLPDRNNTLANSLENSDLVHTLSSLINVMDIAIWQLDLDYRVVGFNQKARDIYGADILGRPCYEIADNRTTVCARCPAQEVYQGAESGRSEHQRLDARGKRIYIDHLATPTRDRNGRLTGALVLIIDITRHKHMEEELIRHRDQLEEIVGERTRELEKTNRRLQQEIADRHNAELALRESENKFRTIFENLQDVYFETTLDGEILTASPSGARLSGYPMEELIGENVDKLYLNPEDRRNLLSVLVSKGRVRDFEMVFKKKNGTPYDVSINADLFSDQDGRPRGLTGTIRDITQQKVYKERKQRLKKMESLGLMAGGIAHDLNNILSGIVSYPDLLLMDMPFESPLRRPIEIIKDSGQRAVDIVSDLLTIARGVATGKENRELNGIIETFLTSAEFIKLRNDNPGVNFDINLQQETLNITCSPPHIRKLLFNLVLNAAEAIADTGNVKIQTENIYLDAPVKGYEEIQVGEYALLRISDTGSGIAGEALGRIFEPFYTKKVMGRSGTGLGLAVVWNAVRDHEGYIDVRSCDQGTCFEIYLPVSRQSARDDKARRKLENLMGGGQTILVVDDDINQRQIACDLLTKLGYHVEAAACGEAAVNEVKAKPYDLLVLDMIMPPGINGRRTYEKIARLRPGQKAIIVSGYTESEDVKAAQALGAGQFLKKPYTVEQIGLAIKQELGG